MQRKTKDGTALDVWLTITKLVDERGRPVAVATTERDVTVRKRSEAAARAAAEQFRRAIEEAPIPVIMHAEDGEVLQISRSWTELTGVCRRWTVTRWRDGCEPTPPFPASRSWR